MGNKYFQYFKKPVLLISLLIIAPALIFCTNSPVPNAKKGIIDLTTWNFEKDGKIRLDGEWELYWNQLLSPAEINNDKKQNLSGYFTFPGLWNKYLINNTKLGGNGYATFHLTIILPDSGTQYACKIGRIETAYNIFINGQPVMSKGVVGTSIKSMNPGWDPTTFHFLSKSKKIDIVLQVSNFYHKKGGISNPLIFGTPTQITRHQEHNVGYELFILGILLIMGMYHFALFSLRRSDLAPLFFGIFCFLSCLHLLANGEILLSEIYPSLPWEILVKLNFIGNYLRVPIFLLFIRNLYKEEISYTLVKSQVIIFSFLTLLIIFEPARVYTHTLIPVEMLILCLMVYVILTLLKAAWNKKTEALFSIFGMFVLLLAALNDILYENMIINTMYIFPFGIFIFIFFQSFLLSMISSRNYRNVENMSERLLTLNKIKNDLLSVCSYDLTGPFKIIMENIMAERGFLILGNNGKWVVETKKIFPDLEAKGNIKVDLEYAKGKNGMPVLSLKIVKHVIKHRENLLINDPLTDERFTGDNYLIASKPKSIFCIPLISKTKLKGILYFENSSRENRFKEEQVKILDLLSSQIATLIDNAEIFWELEILNKNLEKKVEERTQEIILQKEEILAQRDEIEDKNRILQDAYDQITVKNRDITDSINYAQRIQSSVLPPIKYIKNLVPESFILFQPRDILSGDFYCIEKFIKQGDYINEDPSEYIIAAAVDCTGHGVPGALLSIMGYNLLSNIINERKLTNSAEILNELQIRVQNYLHQNEKDKRLRDGMDISLLCYDIKNSTISYSGAKNPVYLLRDGELNVIKADRQSIGESMSLKYKNKSFTNHLFQIKKDDLIYIFSDGYIDQFGGPKNTKFSCKAFGSLILSIYKKPMEEQRQILNEVLEEWRGAQIQTDDILVMGFKFSSIQL